MTLATKVHPKDDARSQGFSGNMIVVSKVHLVLISPLQLVMLVIIITAAAIGLYYLVDYLV